MNKIVVTCAIIMLIMSACVSPKTETRRDLQTPTYTPNPSATVEIELRKSPLEISPVLVTADLSTVVCAQPCWEGLRPGYSTIQEVNQYIRQNLSPQEQATYSDTVEAKRSCRSIFWLSERGERRRKITLEKDIVRYIRIEATSGVTLETVISDFGPPTYVYSVMITPDAVDSWPAHRELRVYYPERGLAFELEAHEDGNITPQLLVQATEYHVPGDAQNALWARTLCWHPDNTVDSAVFRLGAARIEEELVYLQNWTGYGQILTYEHHPNALPLQLQTPAATPKIVK